MTVASLRRLGEDDLPQLMAIRQVAYGDNRSLSDPDVRAVHVRRLPYTYGAFVGESLASAMMWLPFTMHVGGRPVRVTGLAGVLTAAEWRRRGFVRTLLRDGLERLRDEGVGWSTEYPFDPFYYAKYGYASIPNGVRLRVPSALLYPFAAPVEARRVHEGDGPALAAMKAIYAEWAPGHTFTMVRDETVRSEWTFPFRHPFSDEARFVYLLEDAFCVVTIREDDRSPDSFLNVEDFAFRSAAGRANLLSFWGGFHGQVEAVQLVLPGDDPLLPSVPGFVRPHDHPLQARVVDVVSALRGFASIAGDGGRGVLRVRDDFCPWNDGRFALEWNAGGVRAERVDSAAEDLTLDVRTLAALLSGGLSAEAALRAGLVEGDVRLVRALAGASGGRVPFMSGADYF